MVELALIAGEKSLRKITTGASQRLMRRRTELAGAVSYLADSSTWRKNREQQNLCLKLFTSNTYDDY